MSSHRGSSAGRPSRPARSARSRVRWWLDTWQLQKYSNGTVFDNELWGANTGVLR